MPTKRIFFSHASEDKATVLAVHSELIAHFPDLDAWIDTYEIVGGDSLLDKIAEGMDNADKFFVFLSPISVTKPWVQRELNRALTQEIKGTKPDYVVPVLLGNIDRVPPFLEEKKYIDLHRQTVAEWTAEMKASIDGKDALLRLEPNANLRAKWHTTTGRPNVGAVTFSVASWAENLSFYMRTTVPVFTYDHVWIKGGFRGGFTAHDAPLSNEAGDHFLVYALANTRLSPGDEFQVRMRFPAGVSFKDSFISAGLWDGSGPSNTLISQGSDFSVRPPVDGPDEAPAA
ncbi:toll/interleukin-1 receptor domain-containing protein [Cryobacterium lactosi]|uniref:toll/interleukin-1 receptor domain-containing protein n=1 Tax=Cryobacterium lactosi TaxID=1259202 RepID=UPI00141AE6B6|nr:toll/interleukin-1 receptor domain-containing protein [Cryobacterium lactosi]